MSLHRPGGGNYGMDGLAADIARIGKRGLLAVHRPGANALHDREGGTGHLAPFQRPGIAGGRLEIEVTIVGTSSPNARQAALDLAGVEIIDSEKLALRMHETIQDSKQHRY